MHTIIHTPTPDLQQSLEFYTRLRFQLLSPSDPVLLTDGKMLIEINPDRFARPGVKLFKSSWEQEIETLSAFTKPVKLDKGHLLSDPSGVWIYLLEGEPPLPLEADVSSSSVLGNFAGLSLETTDLARSAAVWQTLGFALAQGGEASGWMALVNDAGLGISLMKPLLCPHLFFNPSLTYFNGKENNPRIIQEIRDLGIPITEEITHFNPQGVVDNIIIRDPGGYGFFIFND